MTFKELAVGDTFDFVQPESIWNSFYLRCTKISQRRYQDEKGMVHQVGTIKCEVYNIVLRNESEGQTQS